MDSLLKKFIKIFLPIFGLQYIKVVQTFFLITDLQAKNIKDEINKKYNYICIAKYSNKFA